MDFVATAGTYFVFQVEYIDATGAPRSVTGATISAAYYVSPSTYTVLFSGSMTAASGGRYTYRALLPSTLDEGTILYVTYQATEGLTVLRTQDSVRILSPAEDGGLRTRFVR
jgi:hypothetical protein